MNFYSEKEIQVIWLDSFNKIEYKYKKEMLEMSETEGIITQNLSKYYQYIVKNLGEKVYNALKNSLNGDYIENILQELCKKNIIAVTRFSDDYPLKLCEIPAPPIILYCKGNVKLLSSDKMLGAVGSRKTQAQILKTAENFTNQLSNKGITIVSGLAEGADTACITGALKSGNIISVLAYGFDFIYPQSAASILSEITKKGLVITEHNPSIGPLPYLFVVRNRIIAALSDACLIVSAGEKSGASVTAGYAEEYGKDLFAFPYGIGIASGVGCNELIKKGAKLCDCMLDIAAYFGIDFEDKNEKVELSEKEKVIYALLKEKDCHINELAKSTQLKIYELMPIISALEIKKLVVRSGLNIYSAV